MTSLYISGTAFFAVTVWLFAICIHGIKHPEHDTNMRLFGWLVTIWVILFIFLRVTLTVIKCR